MNAPVVMEAPAVLDTSTNVTRPLEDDQRSLNTPINLETMEATTEAEDQELDNILDEALDHMERHEEELARQLADQDWTLD